MVATTLTVVSCLHRHASLDSMREVETFQPLASPPTFGRTTHGTRLSTHGNAFNFPAESRVPPGLATAGGTRLPEKVLVVLNYLIPTTSSAMSATWVCAAETMRCRFLCASSWAMTARTSL